MKLASVAHALRTIESLTLETLICFVTLASAIKNDIILTQEATYDPSLPPLHLPDSILTFLCGACSLSLDSVRTYWSELASSIWSDEFALKGSHMKLFQEYGYQHGFTAKTFYPPYDMCPDRGCDRHKKGLRLSKAQQLRAVYFSLDDGAVPAYSISMQCEGCSTTYHHNYKVAGDDRIYYDFVDGLPDVLQVASHYFVDTRIGRLWKTMMHTACTSATNCARIYNSAMAQDNQFPPGWKFSLLVTMDHVWDNCSLAKHVKDDPFFKNIGLSVDVFHFNCKHSEADTFCQENCNPAAFPELTGDNGTWYFNSSACEQANAWFGKYNPITRGMRPEKYDFFLDEMIACRNEVTLEKLKKEKRKPSTWPSLDTFEQNI